MPHLHAMPMSQYHDGSHVGIHGLLEFERYGPEFYKRCVLGQVERKKDSRDKHLGTIGHMLILEDERVFESSVVVRPETYTNKDGETKPWNMNAKACQEWAAEQEAKGLLEITAKERGMLLGMNRAVHAECPHIFRKGMSETTIRCVMDGVPVQCRVDWLVVEGPDKWDWREEVDLKTVDEIESAPWDIRNLNYIRHRAWYRRILALEGVALDAHWLLFVEKHPAHRVWMREVTKEEMDAADAQNMATFARFAECYKKDVWPRLSSAEVQERMRGHAVPDGAM
jgi:hypothetical protein